MSGAHGGRRGGRGGGGGREGGRGNVNMTQEELNNLLQQHVNVALAAFQAAHNAMGGKSIATYSTLFLGILFPSLIVYLSVLSQVALLIPLHLSFLTKSAWIANPTTLMILKGQWDCSGGWKKLYPCSLCAVARRATA